MLSAALGRPVTFHPLTFDEQKQAMADAGVPDHIAEMNAQAVSLFAQGDSDWITDDVPSILARPAGSFGNSSPTMQQPSPEAQATVGGGHGQRARGPRSATGFLASCTKYRLCLQFWQGSPTRVPARSQDEQLSWTPSSFRRGQGTDLDGRCRDGHRPLLADWNETHIYNPTWPPHAKFHNGQTMSMGAGLAAMTFWQLWRVNDSPAATRQALDVASLAASMYWLTNTSALAYPGAKAIDPPGTAAFPQWKFVLPSLLLVAIGYRLERRRLGNR